jgi:hypothetical protein
MIIPKAELTASGRPRLAQGEIERALLDKVRSSARWRRGCSRWQEVAEAGTLCTPDSNGLS